MAPSMSDVSETKCSLNFGSRAMKITTNAYINVEVRQIVAHGGLSLDKSSAIR